MAYIDTSVLVAYYSPEALSLSAQAEIRRAVEPSISALTVVEFISVLAIKIRTNEMDEASARSILSVFQLHRSSSVYRIVPIETREHTIACKWLETFRTSLRALDALHLAAAFAHELKLITADKILAQSAHDLGVQYKLIS
jgi:uncharacterized protein